MANIVLAKKPCKNCGGYERYKVEGSKYHGPCPSCQKVMSRAWRKNDPSFEKRLRQALKLAKSRAQAKGLPFDIKLEDLEVPSVCPALGIPLTQPSIDRHRNELGYVRGNVRVISYRANRIKSDATPEELRLIAAYARS